MHDNPPCVLKEDSYSTFVCEQHDKEIKLGCFSSAFRVNLLPGMYTILIGIVPKPHSVSLHLVVGQSAGDYSLNSFIPREQAHTHLDTLNQLRKAILKAKQDHSGQKLVVFKFDVSQAYHYLSIHQLWQIHQMLTINSHCHVDHCNNFGNCGTCYGTILSFSLI